MRKAREILRQKWELERSHREGVESQEVSVGAITGVVQRALSRGLGTWEAIAPLSEEELEARLYETKRSGPRPAPDCLWIHTQRQRRGVTLELLHLEYLEPCRGSPQGFDITCVPGRATRTQPILPMLSSVLASRSRQPVGE
jgi:hypothetical protein